MIAVMLPWRSRRQRGEGLLVVGTKKDMMMMIRVAAKISNPVVGKIRTIFLNSFLCSRSKTNHFLSPTSALFVHRHTCEISTVSSDTLYTNREASLPGGLGSCRLAKKTRPHRILSSQKRVDTARQNQAQNQATRTALAATIPRWTITH